MTEIPRIISVDDHVMEPPDLFRRRLPARFRDEEPRVERGNIDRMSTWAGRVMEQSGGDAR